MNEQGVSRFIVALLALLLNAGAATAEVALGTSFTYQGQLQRDGVPANGIYQFQFKLYDAPAGGSTVGSPNTVTENESVSNGMFTVELNFGPDVFTGYERYLEIGVRPSGSEEAYTILSPRQKLLPAPYAHYAVNAGAAGFVPWNGVIDMPAGFGDGVDNDTTYTAGVGLTLSGTQFRVDTAVIQARVNGSCAVGSSIRRIYDDGTVVCEPDDNSGGTVTAITAGTGLTGGTITDYGTIGVAFGTTSSTVARGDHAHYEYWRTNGNGSGPDDFLGTTNSRPLEFRVNNERALLLDATGESINTIGGAGANTFTAGATGATISGGGSVGDTNQVTDNYGTVGGGYGNRAGDGLLPVNSAEGATVGGGIGNTAAEHGSTVGGGADNEASGFDATVSGGFANTAIGSYATVPGGRDNAASANYSFAAGRGAKANHAGAFVWADSSNFDFSSASANSFRVRATNGVRLVLGIDGTGNSTWSCVVNDGNSWSCSSDRNLKENLTPVDGRDVLQRLSRVPIQTWNAKGQDPGVKHLGPTAQDFSAAFALGDDDTRISTIDLDGVALAAIQGVYRIVQEKEAQIGALEARLAALEEAVGTNRAPGLVPR